MNVRFVIKIGKVKTLQAPNFIMIMLPALIFSETGWACPKHSDVSAGVRVDFRNGSHEIHTRFGENVVASDSFSDEGKRWTSKVTSYGIFETEITYFDESGSEEEASYEFSYSFDPSAYFPISEGASVRGRQFELADFGEQFTNRYRVDIGEATGVRIGECVYTGLPVSFTYGSWWDQDEDQGVYISELGVLLEGDVSNQTGMKWMQDASIAVVTE